MVDFVSISQALLVADQSSFSGAARVLGVTQSAVSRRIQALEDELGVSLFERQTSGVRPTIAGQGFLERTRAAFAEIGHAINNAAAAGRGDEGVIRIGVPPSFFPDYLGDFLVDFCAAHPGVMVDILDGAPRKLTARVIERRLDIAFVVDGAMTLRTGISKSGKAHRHYTCSTAARVGKTGCKGRSIAMDGLDGLVTTHLADRLLGPNRLAGLPTSLAEKRASSDAEVQGRASILQGEIAHADDKLRRLYKMVEDGITDLDDVLGDRLAVLKTDRERAKAALERVKIQSAPNLTLESDQIERFGAFMRERITTGEITFRKAYLRSIVDAIEVDDKTIRIRGSEASLEQAVIAGE